VKIDPTIPLDVACLVGCGVATGFGSATNAADVRPGDVVVVIGAGGVGMNAVQGAALAGAANVVVVDTAPAKLKWATEFGATETFGDLGEADQFVKSITNGQGADSAILTAATVDNELIGRGLGVISKGGTLVITGVSSEHESGHVPGFNALGMALMQKRIQGVLYGMASPRDAMPGLLRQYQVGRLKLDELITRRYPLNEVMTGFSDMAEGRNIRGVIDFSL
jgi:Zn-dependent alcohol dehydrogenase